MDKEMIQIISENVYDLYILKQSGEDFDLSLLGGAFGVLDKVSNIEEDREFIIAGLGEILLERNQKENLACCDFCKNAIEKKYYKNRIYNNCKIRENFIIYRRPNIDRELLGDMAFICESFECEIKSLSDSMLYKKYCDVFERSQLF